MSILNWIANQGFGLASHEVSSCMRENGGDPIYAHVVITLVYIEKVKKD